MDRGILIYSLAILVLTADLPAIGAEPHTKHTFKLAANEERPAASLEDAAWLAGSWVGTAFGERFEEVWNQPSAGSMLGMWKLYGDKGVNFYELLLLTVENGTLSLKVKHFQPDFTAWEDKAEHVNFRLVKLEKNALHFGGISFYRLSDDRIDAYIVLHDGEEVKEHQLVYKRWTAD
jgi:hypothetical protein